MSADYTANLESKLQQVALWLDHLAQKCDDAANTCNHLSLRDAYMMDSRNYRATAKDIRSVLKVEPSGGIPTLDCRKTRRNSTRPANMRFGKLADSSGLL